MWIVDKLGISGAENCVFSCFLPKFPTEQRILPVKSARKYSFPHFQTIFRKLLKTFPKTMDFPKTAGTDSGSIKMFSFLPFRPVEFSHPHAEGKSIWIPLRKTTKYRKPRKYRRFFVKIPHFVGVYTRFCGQRKSVSKNNPQKSPTALKRKIAARNEKQLLSDCFRTEKPQKIKITTPKRGFSTKPTSSTTTAAENLYNI